MTQNTPLPWNSMPTEKANCCQMHLEPLVKQINVLQTKLQQETQRREKQYNQLLKMILTGKRQNNQHIQICQQKNQGNRKRELSKGYRKITSPSSRRPAIKLPIPKKSNHFEQNVDNTVKKEPVAMEKVSNNEISCSMTQFQGRMATCEQNMSKYSSELTQIKELNQYLMGQLLTIFQKIKQFDSLSQLVKKTEPSEQTVTSLVFDQEHQSVESDNIKIVNKQNNTSSRTVRSDLSKADLGQIAARVSEHEGMLADLIELTKNLSSQIKNLPPQWSISPRA